MHFPKSHRCTTYWKSNWWLNHFFIFLISRLFNPLKEKWESKSKLQQSYDMPSLLRQRNFINVRYLWIEKLSLIWNKDNVMMLFSSKYRYQFFKLIFYYRLYFSNISNHMENYIDFLQFNSLFDFIEAWLANYHSN